MAKLRLLLVSVVGVVVSVVTLRRFRRRKEEQDEEPGAKAEINQAAEHSAAALQHARQAGEKAVESGREKVAARAADEDTR